MVMTSEWRRERIFAYLDPWSEEHALGKGYQLSHSLIAFGRGEIFGVGLGGSVEKLHWLPEAHTDFLLAVIGEEFGLVGVLVLIGLFLWLTRRIMHIGRQAIALDQVFAGLVAQGVGLWMGFQAFINMGVNLGALPTKGLTLPLMSYGGSAILLNLVAIGDRAAGRLRKPPDDEGGPFMSRNLARLIMAGGTGGHIFPGLAVAEALRERGWRVHWLGAPGSMESRLVPPRGFALETIDFGGVRGKGVITLVLLPLRLLRAFWQALQVVRRVKPDVVVGLGGYITFPGRHDGRACWASRWCCTSRTRWPAWPTRCWPVWPTGCSPPSPTCSPRPQWVGNPLRAPFLRQPAPAERFAGRSGPLRLLVVGGSLGAKALNDIVPQALALIPEPQRPTVVHQSGEKQIDALRANYAAAGVHAELTPFIDDTAQAFADADLIVCRAGASTVTEIAAVGAAALFVPFPSAVDDHQTTNARFLVDAGARLAGAANRTQPPAARARVCKACSANSWWPWPRRPSRCRKQKPWRPWCPPASNSRKCRTHETRHSPYPFRRHRRRRHERHRRGAAQPGLPHLRQRPGRERGHAPPGRPGCRGVHRPRRRAHRRRRRHRHLHRGEGRQPRGGGRPRQADPGGAARGDAGRADAHEEGCGDCRHPRQDHHHQPGGQRAGRGRTGPHLRDRRAPQQRRCQRRAGLGRVHRGRGRRVRRLVPQPAARAVGGDQHRRRPHGHLRPRLRQAQGRLRRVPAPHAVLRRGRGLCGRRRHPRDPAADRTAHHQLRLLRRRAGARHQRARGRHADALHRAAPQRRGAARPRRGA